MSLADLFDPQPVEPPPKAINFKNITTLMYNLGKKLDAWVQAQYVMSHDEPSDAVCQT
jgi:hypothetical protein